MERNKRRFRFAGSDPNEWILSDETATDYVLRLASGFQIVNIPKSDLDLSSANLLGRVVWNPQTREFVYVQSPKRGKRVCWQGRVYLVDDIDYGYCILRDENGNVEWVSCDDDDFYDLTSQVIVVLDGD